MSSQPSRPVLSREHCLAYVTDVLFSQAALARPPLPPSHPGSIGIELEMLPLALRPQKTIPELVPVNRGNPNLFSVMRELAREQGWQIEEESPHQQDGPLVARITTDQFDYFTFEPGGQLEFSSHPYDSLPQLSSRLALVHTLLDQAFAEPAWILLQVGANPWYGIKDIGLQLTKPRYRAMDRYFARKDAYGQMMMRQTCSIQVCLDFGSDETTKVERYLAAQLLSPFAMALFANSPYIAKTSTADIQSQRAHIWLNLDPQRSGFPQLDRPFQLQSMAALCQSYLDFLLAAPVIFITACDYQVPPPSLTFARWMADGYRGIYPELQDFIVHGTLHFPEVRPHGFLELRAVDTQARIWQLVPAGFFAGLLYAPRQRHRVLNLLAPQYSNAALLRQAAPFGLQNPQIATTAQTLMGWAQEGLSQLPEDFRDATLEKTLTRFFEHFTAQGRTPAHDIRAFVKQDETSFPRYDSYRRLEAYWQNL